MHALESGPTVRVRWFHHRLAMICVVVPLTWAANVMVAGTDPPPLAFEKDVQPLLKEFCYDCHGDGMNKGKVVLDEFKSQDEAISKKELWLAVLKNVRSGLMPPEKKARPSTAQRAVLERWIKSDVFNLDPADPDPGRVTVRRLNRVEYRNTIRDLMGVDFDTDLEFPADDTGHGFDNIGDVLTLSPMLIEKYLAAAKVIVDRAVPASARVAPEKKIPGTSFVREDFGTTNAPAEPQKKKAGAVSFSYYDKASAFHIFNAEHSGRYQVVVDLTANEKFVDGQFDLNKCRAVFRADGEELLRQEFTREGGRPFHFEYDREWASGEHRLTLDLEPLTPDEKRVRSLSLRLDSVLVRGPFTKEIWVRPNNFARFFTQDVPENPEARRAYAREVLSRFATKAYRRPVDGSLVDRLVDLAEKIYRQPGKTFETGTGQAMVAVLASPRFLFREEPVEPIAAGSAYPEVDEYALASRLSYFLWSSLPDDELIRLAGEGKLRANLEAQLERMLEDSKSEALIRNFIGQWLQARDIETVAIDHRAVMGRETEVDPEQERTRARFRALRDKDPDKLTEDEKNELAKSRQNFFRGFGRFNKYELNGELRRAMRQETEKYFEYVLREDRSLLELLDSDYAFLNKRLAEHYGIPGVEGDEIHRVALAVDSSRGGILTQGTVLAVTANPTRTSPVKRGLFILENILGMPPPPPPPDIPPLEDSAKKVEGRELTLRETLAAHRQQPLCSSCHDRMDPLGLALENFNALGRWREKERGQPVDVAGKLITGERFASIRELKHILVKERRDDFYRCFTEKLLTYALGRGLEYYDVETVDQLVKRLQKANGRPSALLRGIVESAAFQKRRNLPAVTGVIKLGQPQQRADNEVRP